MTTARSSVLEPVVSERRRRGAVREQAQYKAFCQTQAISASTLAVALYLTWLLDTRAVTGRGLRYRLHLLDLHARLAGEAPPSADHELRRYLRGLHREAALATPEKATDPLYPELLALVVDEVVRPQAQQLHDLALVLLANITGLPAIALADLRWGHVRFCRDHLEITVPPMRHRGTRANGAITVPEGSGPLSARAALEIWRRTAGPAERPVFSLNGRTSDLHRVSRVVAALGRERGRVPHVPLRGRRLQAVVDAALAPPPSAARDQALLLLGFAGALGTDDACALRQRDVRADQQGVRLRVTGRADGWIAVPKARDLTRCPVAAWERWLAVLGQLGLAHQDGPAFPQVFGSVVKPVPLAPQGLNRIVHQRCDAAGLRGDWSFTSLRTGFIRAALRGGAPEHVVARHVGLSAMHSVQTHLRREMVSSGSAATLVGL